MDAMTPPEAINQDQREMPRPRGRQKGQAKLSPEEVKARNAEAARRYREKHAKNKAGAAGADPSSTGGEDRPWEAGTKPEADQAFSEPGRREPPKRRKAKAADPAEVGRLAQFLGAAHMMLANGMKAPEMVLHEAECHALATSLIGVMEQYDYTLDPKVAAVVSLAVVSFGIYVPRLAAVGARVKAAKAQAAPRPAQQAQGGNVAQAGMVQPARRSPDPGPTGNGGAGGAGSGYGVSEVQPAQVEMYGAPLQYDGPAGSE